MLSRFAILCGRQCSGSVVSRQSSRQWVRMVTREQATLAAAAETATQVSDIMVSP